MKSPFHGALSLLVFLLTIICTYALAPQGLKLRIPRTRWSVFISFCWVPWLAAVLLLVFQAITFKDVDIALRGDGSLWPSSIVVTYLSLTYLAISCEITGLFSWLALHVARWTRGRPVLLMAVLFGLSGALTAVTSPDVSLVTLTPMVAYAAGAANLDPMAMAATHMSAASVWGMLVPVAGPVNIITSQAFQLSFISFLGWMALPTSAAAVTVFSLLYALLYRQRLGSARNDAGAGALPYPDPGVLLHDQVGAACSSALLVGCLLALAVGPWLRWSGWLVTTVFALVAALYNLAASSGPLRPAIGRRSAYERRRRLQAELAQQGLYRVVSDEDFADLLLSAAQDRQASFTRLAAATASHIAASAPALPSTVLPPSASFGARSSIQRRDANGSSSWSFAGIGARLSSSGLERSGGSSGPGQSLHCLVSLIGGGGGGSGGSAGLGSSPVRHWFSRRWSSFHGFSMPEAAATELVEAAAAAGADGSILGVNGVVVPTAAAGRGASADGADATSSMATTGAPVGTYAIVKGEFGDGTFGTRHNSCVSRTATGTGGQGGGGSGPGLPRVSSELHHLLTHGTSAAPDTLEWWAAAALAGQELLDARGDLPVGNATVATSAMPYLPAEMSKVDLPVHLGTAGKNGIEANGDCGNLAGGCLKAASPFASPTAMSFPGWDGRLPRASVCWNGAASVEANSHKRQEVDGRSGSAARTASSHRRQRSRDNFDTGTQHRVGSASHVVEEVPDSSRDTYVAVDSCKNSGGGTGGGAGGGHGGVRWKSFHARTGPVSLRAVSSEGGSCSGVAAAMTADIGRSSHCSGRVGGSAAAAPVTHYHCQVPPRIEIDQRSLAKTSPCQNVGGPFSELRHHHHQQLQKQQQGTPEAARASSTAAEHSLSSSAPRCMQTSPRGHRSTSLPPRHSFNTAPDERGSDQGHLSASAALLPPMSLDQGTASPEAPLMAVTPLPEPLSPASGLASGLFNCWWRRTIDLNVTAAESAALLPSRAAASDDPSYQTQAPLPSLAQTPPLPNAEKPLVLTAESTPIPSDLQQSLYKSLPPVHDPHDNGCADGFADGPFPSLSLSVGGTADDGGRGGANDHEGSGQHGPTGPSACQRSPFAASDINFGNNLIMRPRAASDEDGAAADCGGGRLSRGNSSGGSGSGSITSWNHCMLRRPAVALLLLGSSEMSFLGTFLALPWANTVFLLGWFVLVETMQVHGWLDALARFLTSITGASDPPLQSVDLSTGTLGTGGSSSSSSTSTSSRSPGAVAGVVFAIGWLAALMSVGMTGQSAALLLARVVMHPEFLAALQQTATPEGPHTGMLSAAVAGGSIRTGAADGVGDAAPGLMTAEAVSAAHRGAQLALVIAANMAPALSLSGSLTALRWGLRLKDLGVQMRCCKYMVSGLGALAGTAVALLVLWAQCVVWQQQNGNVRLLKTEGL